MFFWASVKAGPGSCQMNLYPMDFHACSLAPQTLPNEPEQYRNPQVIMFDWFALKSTSCYLSSPLSESSHPF